MSENFTKVSPFKEEKTKDLFEQLTRDTEEIRTFLPFFRQVIRHHKALMEAYDDYIEQTEENLAEEYKNGNMPSEDLIPQALAEEHTLVQKLLLEIARFSNL